MMNNKKESVKGTKGLLPKAIKGMMFVRKWPSINKAVLVSVVDADTVGNLVDERHHVIIGSELPDGRTIMQTTGEIVDYSSETKGMCIDGILTTPIWRT